MRCMNYYSYRVCWFDGSSFWHVHCCQHRYSGRGFLTRNPEFPVNFKNLFYPPIYLLSSNIPWCAAKCLCVTYSKHSGNILTKSISISYQIIVRVTKLLVVRHSVFTYETFLQIGIPGRSHLQLGLNGESIFRGWIFRNEVENTTHGGCNVNFQFLIKTSNKCIGTSMDRFVI